MPPDGPGRQVHGYPAQGAARRCTEQVRARNAHRRWWGTSARFQTPQWAQVPSRAHPDGVFLLQAHARKVDVLVRAP